MDLGASEDLRFSVSRVSRDIKRYSRYHSHFELVFASSESMSMHRNRYIRGTKVLRTAKETYVKI